MRQSPKRRRPGHYFDLPPRWRWVFWPVVALSGAGAVLALWVGEIPIAAGREACAPLAVLLGMAGLFYWFNHLVFKASQPRREDLSDETTSGEKNP